MRSLIIVFCFSFFWVNVVQACFCELKPIDISLERADAVFIGVLTQIIYSDSLFMYSGREPDGIKYFNFKVLKYCKGLGSSSDYISVFDEHSNCGGYCRGAKVGDTLLLFANLIGPTYSSLLLYGSQCHRFAKISNDKHPDYYGDSYGLRPLEDEMQFLLDSTIQWKTPEDRDAIFEQISRSRQKNKLSKKIPLINWFLLASLLLNLLLAVLLWRRSVRK